MEALADTSSSHLISCRLAQQDDVDFIYKCLKLLAQEEAAVGRLSQTPESLQKVLFSDEAFAECVIAELEHLPVAILLFSVVNLNFTFFPTPGIYVHDLYVGKDYRRHGIARELGNYLKQLGRQRGCSRIDGIVPKSNQGAMAFYQTIEDIRVLDYIHYMRLNLR